jgi:hypothetical protein
VTRTAATTRARVVSATRPTVLACEPDYYGVMCDVRCASDNCVRGTCDRDNGTCACEAHYFGATCATYCKAEETCSGRGQCGASGACECERAYSGVTCDWHKATLAVIVIGSLLGAAAVICGIVWLVRRHRNRQGYQSLDT